jgi:Rrf2 family protein
MQFSMSIEYAIHGLVYLARAHGEPAVLLGDIASAIRVPKEYMRKIFQQLARKRLVLARRGVKGGYRLARPAAELSLKEVVEAVEGSLPLYHCLSLQRHCGLSPSCPVQRTFRLASEKMAEVLQSVSIQDLSREIKENRSEHSWLKVTA